MTKDFVERNYKLIQYIASRVGNKLSIEDREDLINDTVIKLLESEADVDTEHASAYVNRIMLNVIIDKNRHDRTDAMYHTESLDAPVDKDEPDGMTMHEVIPDVDVSNFVAKHRKAFNNMCKQLPNLQGKILFMRYADGMTPQEIADEMCMENKAVRMTLLRAKQNAFQEG